MELRRPRRFYMLVLAVLLLSPVSTATASGSQSGPRSGAQWGWEVYREALSYSRDYQGTIRVESPGGGVEIAVLKVGDLTRVTLPRDGGQTTILRKGEKVALKGLPVHGWWKLFGPDLPLDEALLQQNYMIKAEPARWEGREIWRLELTPRHPGNPSRLVMVDRAWLLPLYMEDRSSGGQVIQSRSLKGLVAPPRISAAEIAELERLIRDEGRKIPGGPPPIISAREAARDLGFEPVLPGYLPEGYWLLGVRISRRESGLAHILFYNGVGVISLYEQRIPWWARSSSKPSPGAAGDAGYGAQGGSSPGAAIVWEANGIRRTIVGDVPEGELLRMAKSFKR